jgi:PPOX class probable F420-dependent enzyme
LAPDRSAVASALPLQVGRGPERKPAARSRLGDNTRSRLSVEMADGSCDALAMATLADLAQEEFVSLTTYRRSGDAVSVPVWIAPATDARGGLLVTTTERSAKVKRLRRDRRVQLRPCDRRGAVARALRPSLRRRTSSAQRKRFAGLSAPLSGCSASASGSAPGSRCAAGKAVLSLGPPMPMSFRVAIGLQLGRADFSGRRARSQAQ